MARVGYCRGNPLHGLASKGLKTASLQARGLRRSLVDALLAHLPQSDGEHKKFRLHRVVAAFLRAVLDEDVGSLERAYDRMERERLARLQEPARWKGNPDGETTTQQSSSTSHAHAVHVTALPARASKEGQRPTAIARRLVTRTT